MQRTTRGQGGEVVDPVAAERERIYGEEARKRARDRYMAASRAASRTQTPLPRFAAIDEPARPATPRHPSPPPVSGGNEEDVLHSPIPRRHPALAAGNLDDDSDFLEVVETEGGAALAERLAQPNPHLERLQAELLEYLEKQRRERIHRRHRREMAQIRWTLTN